MRRILVTGANKGIGYAIVEAVLSEAEDTFVYLGSRSVERGQAARDSMVKANPSWANRVELLELDVSDDDSVAAAARRVRSAHSDEEGPLYAVVNNAGLGFGASDLAGILAVNTYGMRRVSEAFLGLLNSESGRVVNVTSASGPNFVSGCSPARQRFFANPEISWEELEAVLQECLACASPQEYEAAGFGDGNAYGISKAAGNSYTMILAGRKPNLRVNACTPGWIATDLTQGFVERSQRTPEELGMRAPAEGTVSTLFLLFGEPEGNGHYYGSDAQRSPMDRYRSPGSPPYLGD